MEVGARGCVVKFLLFVAMALVDKTPALSGQQSLPQLRGQG